MYGPPQFEQNADFANVWAAANAFVHGAPAYPFFGDHFTLGYAPPFVVLFAPAGFLSRDVAIGLAAVLAGVLGALAILAWSRRGGRLEPWALALLLSAPMVSLVRSDQLASAVGLAALSLAIWAQRRDRWVLAGAATAVGLLRTSNGLPVLAMLLVVAWIRPRQLAMLGGGILAVLGPLVAVAFLWDASWIQDYAQNLGVYSVVGFARVAHAAGPAGDIGFVLGGCVLAAAIAWPSRGKALDLDRAALGLATTALFASEGGLFAGVYVLPAVARLAMRPGFGAVAWAVAVVPWAVILVVAPLMLGSSPEVLNLLTLAVPLLVVAVYPLVRRPSVASQPSELSR